MKKLGYIHQYYNHGNVKGRHGIAILSKIKPIKVTYGLGSPEHDSEGRFAVLEFKKFYMATAYVPCSREH